MREMLKRKSKNPNVLIRSLKEEDGTIRDGTTHTPSERKAVGLN